MKLHDDIRNKINFYYNNPTEYNFLTELLNDRKQLNDFIIPSKPNTLDRSIMKDRLLMMRIIYMLQKLAKEDEIMSKWKADVELHPRAYRNGLRLFNITGEVILAVLFSFLVSIVVAIYFNIYLGLILVPVLGILAFYFVKQHVVTSMEKKVLELGSDLLKHDKNRYL